MIFVVRIKATRVAPLFVGATLLLACKKDKVPCPEPVPELTKWEEIAGTYKVYDSTGTEYLYDMNIVHIPNESANIDSLRFENFDGEFEFTSLQVEFSNMPMYVRIGSHDTLYDSQSNRWKIHSGPVEGFNSFENDTIRLRFNKTNINYYIEDLTPYYACNCKQIAVKQ